MGDKVSFLAGLFGAKKDKAVADEQVQVLRKIYLATGDFMHLHKLFAAMPGVISCVPGFANGYLPEANYELVSSSQHGFAFAMELTYDSACVSLEDLVSSFFDNIDATALHTFGEKSGSCYRTGIYYVKNSERPVIGRVMDQYRQDYDERIVVELRLLQNFIPASWEDVEDYAKE